MCTPKGLIFQLRKLMLREVDAPVQIRFNPNVTLERKPLPSLLCVSEEVSSGLIQKADTVSAA